ncbi:hypothetical protein [Microbacterium sp.]|uniref:hypothetical protein n=1 Tax=Microbacterium sp. TaxID=51671 RepID=UPI003C73CE7D
MTTATICVQAIHYTAAPEKWHDLALALGLTPAFAPQRNWSEFDGEGVLAVHAVDAGDALAETTQLHLLVSDLEACAESLIGTGVRVERTVLDDVGPLLVVTAVSGACITLSAGVREVHGAPMMQPIWFDADSAAVAPILTAVGLRPVLASDAGSWIEFEASGGGSVAFHAAESPSISFGLVFEGDLEVLSQQVAAAGFETSIVDEAYNRTLLITTPVGWHLWVAGPYDDMYGYHRIE